MASKRQCGCQAASYYLLLRFPADRQQSCMNALSKLKSVITVHKGKVCGIAEVEIAERVEDHLLCNAFYQQHKSQKVEPWPKWEATRIVWMEFDCQCHAEKWLASCPEVKQKDWLTVDLDIVGFPASGEKLNFLTHSALCMVDIFINDMEKFEKEYGKAAKDVLDELTTKEGLKLKAKTVTAPKVHRFRGLWRPAMLVLHQFGSMKQIHQYHKAIQPSVHIRQEATQSNLIFMDMCDID